MKDKIEQLQSNIRRQHPMPRHSRLQHLDNLKQLIINHKSEICTALEQDLGKPAFESWLMEINMLVGEIEFCSKSLKKWMKPKKVKTPVSLQPAKSYLLPEPKGLVLVLGAWNYPFILTLGPMISAIAAGNAVVIKPSELSSASSNLMAKLIPEYMDKKTFLCIEGDAKTSADLLTFPFDHIFYTGGSAVGKIVMRAAAENLTPVTLELGGKSPAIVWDSKHIDTVAARLAWGKWTNAGQTCIAPDYILVKSSIKNELIEALKTAVNKFYGESPMTSPSYGKIVNQRHFQRLVGYLDNQKIAFGGETCPDNQKIAPTVLEQPNISDSVMTEEIFGPILPVVSMDSVDDCIEFVNRREKPLALYVFSDDKSIQQQITSATSAGNMLINDTLVFMSNHHLPFGGVGQSGLGRYHGYWGFENMSHLKTVMNRGIRIDPPLRYPPYSNTKQKLMQIIYRIEKYLS
jgi:aldehyde dehydrogenase (NAD+)